MRCLLPSYPSCDPSLSPLSLATTLSIFPSFSLIVLPTCIPCPAPLQILGHARPRHQTRLLHLRQLPRVPHRPGTIIVLVLLISMLAPCAFISANSCHAKTTKFTTITTIFSIADLTLSLSLFTSHIVSLFSYPNILQVENQLYAQLLAVNSAHFEYHACNFSKVKPTVCFIALSYKFPAPK